MSDDQEENALGQPPHSLPQFINKNLCTVHGAVFIRVTPTAVHQERPGLVDLAHAHDRGL